MQPFIVVDGQARVAAAAAYHEQARREEREAREALKRRDKLQRGAERKRDQRDRSKRATVIREELAKPRAKDCQCPINPSMTLRELKDLGAGCTAGHHVCAVLDTIRRRLD